MNAIDWIVVGLFLVAMFALGFAFTRRASKSMADFFVSGRNLPWWLAGTSILATSFASDTPLHVTKVVRTQGLSGLWLFWTSILFSSMVPFLFARLWRRSMVITDCEFLSLRYSGTASTWLRSIMAMFRAVLGIITMSWVVLGMVKIVLAITDLPPYANVGLDVSTGAAITILLVAVAVAYTMASGLWGVVTTDFIEFIIAMTGSFIVAVASVVYVGGIGALKEKLAASAGQVPSNVLDFLPSEQTALPLGAFLVYVLVLGWAHAEADGAGNKAQRYLACKNEGHALLSGIWSVVVKEVLRSWPWYLTALASLIIFPAIDDPEMAYPKVMGLLMPVGLKGVLVAAFFAAFLSTIDTHLNLIASYLINDLYRPYVRKQKSEEHYVRASRFAILAIACGVAILAPMLGSILETLKFKGELMAGLGFVYIARWFWWRISAYSEIAAVVSSVAACVFYRTIGESITVAVGKVLGIDPLHGDLFPARILLVVSTSAALTVAVTFITKPVDMEVLIRFYKRVRPPGAWKPVRAALGHVDHDDSLKKWVFDWLLCSVAVGTCTFAFGKALLAEYAQAFILATVATISGAWAFYRIRRDFEKKEVRWTES